MRYPTVKTPRVDGRDGAFMLTRGQPRYQQLNGRHYVVGRGMATELSTVVEAYAWRDRLLAAEKAKREATRPVVLPQGAHAPEAAARGIAVGDVVEFEIQPGLQGRGRVGEIGAKSLAIDADDGNRYRRAAKDVRGSR
jgi:hypothetical protein